MDRSAGAGHRSLLGKWSTLYTGCRTTTTCKPVNGFHGRLEEHGAGDRADMVTIELELLRSNRFLLQFRGLVSSERLKSNAANYTRPRIWR